MILNDLAWIWEGFGIPHHQVGDLLERLHTNMFAESLFISSPEVDHLLSFKDALLLLFKNI